MNDAITFFRSTRPKWESALEWDDDDTNLEEIEERAEFLEAAAANNPKLAALSMEQISDAAREYLTK